MCDDDEDDDDIGNDEDDDEDDDDEDDDEDDNGDGDDNDDDGDDDDTNLISSTSFLFQQTHEGYLHDIIHCIPFCMTLQARIESRSLALKHAHQRSKLESYTMILVCHVGCYDNLYVCKTWETVPFHNIKRRPLSLSRSAVFWS